MAMRRTRGSVSCVTRALHAPRHSATGASVEMARRAEQEGERAVSIVGHARQYIRSDRSAGLAGVARLKSRPTEVSYDGFTPCASASHRLS